MEPWGCYKTPPRHAEQGRTTALVPTAKIDPRTAAVLTALGARIRSIRQEKKLSQVAVARKIGMLRANYVKIERGKKNVTVDTLLRIADGLGVEMTIDFGEDVRA